MEKSDFIQSLPTVKDIKEIVNDSQRIYAVCQCILI